MKYITEFKYSKYSKIFNFWIFVHATITGVRNVIRFGKLGFKKMRVFDRIKFR